MKRADSEAREPAYLALWREGLLDARREAALLELEDCRACPRDCGVNRLLDERSVCHTGRFALVSSAFAHHGEEACLRGRSGSGTIFFARCNLNCVFCQNADISQATAGREMNAVELAELMLALQAAGCHNVNFVTPEHVVPQIIEALAIAVPQGLRLPLVYNTGAYDALSSLRLMDGLVDIYMPDFKVWTEESARRLLKARDYPQRAREAIREMHRQVGPLEIDSAGLARRGVLVRHLVMPDLAQESEAIFEWLATELSVDTYVNVMGQYRPAHRVGRRGRDGQPRYREIDRPLLPVELEAALHAARAAGLHRFDGVRP